MSGRSAALGVRARRRTAAPGLLDSVTVFAGYSVRRLRAAHAGAALRVQRASDSAEQDIGFTSAGDLDTAALAAFCAGTTGYVAKWYDQSGSGRDLSQTTQARMWRIFTGGAVDMKNSKPTLLAPDDQRGMLSPTFTANTTTLASAFAVASLNNVVTTSAPRYVSVVGASNSDGAAVDGCALIMRGPSAANSWRLLRNGGSAIQTGAYDILQQVAGVESNGSYSVSVDGATTTVASGAGTVASTRILMGMFATTSYATSTGQCMSEFLVSFLSVDVTAIRTDQKAYFGTA